VDYYVCSLRCAELSDRSGTDVMVEDAGGDAIDPVHAMTVSSANALSILGVDGITYNFRSEDCRSGFLDGAASPPPQSIELGREPINE
jgi:YHS domain-containing protein